MDVPLTAVLRSFVYWVSLPHPVPLIRADFCRFDTRIGCAAEAYRGCPFGGFGIIRERRYVACVLFLAWFNLFWPVD